VIARRLPSSRIPKVLDLKVARHGARVEVTFRTDIAAGAGRFLVVGTAGDRRTILTAAEPARTGPRSFRATLPGAARVRFAALLVAGDYSFRPPIYGQVR
jgi:hypothetical protein